MDYAYGQGLGWAFILFYLFPVLFLYPILLIVSLIFKWHKFRALITIISLPALPFYFFYPFSSLTKKIQLLIFPEFHSSHFGDTFGEVFIDMTRFNMLFSVITVGFIIYLFRLFYKQEKDKFKNTLIIYGILFVLFIIIVGADAVISKRIYIEHSSTYFPYLSALIHSV